MSSPNLLQLPPEVMFMVLTSLPSLDQGCFAMSCQYAFSCVLSSLKRQGLELSQLFPRKRYPPLCPNLEKEPRIQFLRRLEDQHWQYCCDCRILHPRLSQSQLDDDKFCLESGICMPHAGQVEICPCLTISFRDMLQMIRDSSSQKERSDYNGVFQIRTSYLLVHHCVLNHPVMDAQITTALQIDKSNFEVTNCFRFTFPTDPPFEAGTSSSLCPYKDPNAWLRTFLDGTTSNFSGWLSTEGPFLINLKMYSGRGMWRDGYFDLPFKRCLGGSEWPNKEWNRHRCN